MLNSSNVMGRLVADPELRHTNSGKPVASFTLASDTGRKTQDGQKITNFIDCVAWDKRAEFASKYLVKGRLIVVEGGLTTRMYEDKDGKKRKTTEINVAAIHFADTKRDDAAGTPTTEQPAASYQLEPNFEPLGDDEELPF